MGCSFTWGVGVEESETWPSQLAKYLGQSIRNLGITGASPERVWMTYLELRQLYTPRLTIIQWPNINRSVSIEQGRIRDLGPWNLPTDIDYARRVFSGEQQQQNRLLINQARTLEPSYQFDYYDLCDKKNWLDLGQDQLHPGPRTQKLIAELLGPAVSILCTTSSPNS